MSDKMIQKVNPIIDSELHPRIKARKIKEVAPYYFTNAAIGKLLNKTQGQISIYLSR